MIILDTNVVSEPLRLAPDAAVLEWMKRQPAADVFVTTISEAEMRFGVARLPIGRKRERLGSLIAAAFEEDFKDRLLTFDSLAARQYGEIVALVLRSGRQIEPLDAQIAAIARAHGAILATRNVKDFANCDIELINPWGP